MQRCSSNPAVDICGNQTGADLQIAPRSATRIQPNILQWAATLLSRMPRRRSKARQPQPTAATMQRSLNITLSTRQNVPMYIPACAQPFGKLVILAQALSLKSCWGEPTHTHTLPDSAEEKRKGEVRRKDCCMDTTGGLSFSNQGGLSFCHLGTTGGCHAGARG